MLKLVKEIYQRKDRDVYLTFCFFVLTIVFYILNQTVLTVSIYTAYRVFILLESA